MASDWASARVRLRADVVLAGDGEAALEWGGERFDVAGIEPPALRRILGRLDGRERPDQIAARAGTSPGAVATLSRQLVAHRLAGLLPEAPPAFLPGDRFAAVCRELFAGWKLRLFEHQLWRALAEGSAPRQIFVGWLLESFHFIDGVNHRLALAVAACPDPQVRALFARHYREEYDHGRFFLDALAAAGRPAEEVRASVPLPSTMAVLHWMRRCARRDPVQYAVCSGLLESTGEDRSRAHGFLERVGVAFAARAGLEPLVKHVELDEAYGHSSMLERICAVAGDLTAARCSAALDAGLRFLETLELWCTDILRAYEVEPYRAPLRRYRAATPR